MIFPFNDIKMFLYFFLVTNHMKRFSVGFNYENDFALKLKPYVKHISSIYFPIPSRFLGSGRTINEPDYYEEQIGQLIKFCKEFGIKSLILLNPLCEGDKYGDIEEMEKVVEHIGSICVDGVVCVNPIYMKMIKSNWPDIEIHASVNCFIKNVESASYYKGLCDVLTVDRDINRDIALLKKINDIVKIKVMVNEGCLSNCPYRVSHYNMLSHGFGSDVEKNLERANTFIENACVSIYREEPWRVLTVPFILPEHLDKYDFVDEFKLSTRTFSTDKIVKVLDAYVNGFDGNIVELLDTAGLSRVIKGLRDLPKGYFDKLANCDRVCEKCGYCEDTYEQKHFIVE